MGLAPVLVERIYETIAEINEQGMTILLVEQNANFALDVSKRGYVLETGTVALSDEAGEAPREPRSAEGVPGRMTVVVAAIGAKALYLTFAWLGSAIVASWLSDRKGYGEKPGLAAGLLLSVVGVAGLAGLAGACRFALEGPGTARPRQEDRRRGAGRAARGRRRELLTDEQPPKLGVLERIGAWLRVWTPPRGAVVPPPPWRKIALGAVVVLAVAGRRRRADRPGDRGGQGGARGGGAPPRRRVRGREAQAAGARRGGRARARASAPPGDLSPAAERRARRRLVRDLERAITRDARARVRAGKLDGPMSSRPSARSTRPSQRAAASATSSVRRMEYDCLAITSRDPGGQFIVGHSFDATVDYRRFRFTWAKVCRPPGEGAARLSADASRVR